MKLSETPDVTICSRHVHRRTSVPEAEEINITQIAAPVRILVPPNCKAEIFTVPQGTEIRIIASQQLINTP